MTNSKTETSTILYDLHSKSCFCKTHMYRFYSFSNQTAFFLSFVFVVILMWKLKSLEFCLLQFFFFFITRKVSQFNSIQSRMYRLHFNNDTRGWLQWHKNTKSKQVTETKRNLQTYRQYCSNIVTDYWNNRINCNDQY